MDQTGFNLGPASVEVSMPVFKVVDEPETQPTSRFSTSSATTKGEKWDTGHQQKVCIDR